MPVQSGCLHMLAKSSVLKVFEEISQSISLSAANLHKRPLNFDAQNSTYTYYSTLSKATISLIWNSFSPRIKTKIGAVTNSKLLFL